MIGQSTIEQTIVHTEIKGLDVIPSNVDLAGAEIDLLDIEDREYILRENWGKWLKTMILLSSTVRLP